MGEDQDDGPAQAPYTIPKWGTKHLDLGRLALKPVQLTELCPPPDMKGIVCSLRVHQQTKGGQAGGCFKGSGS